MIRNEISDKLPDGVICRSRATNGSLQEIERKAENNLWSLAKDISSLKENISAISDDEIRQILEVSLLASLYHSNGLVESLHTYYF